MRAAEALMLGSTMMTPKTRVFDNDKGNGCALGMINRALGGTSADQRMPKVFRWMWETVVPYPCSCGKRPQPRSHVHDMVIHLFDNHYEDRQDPWMISRIAEWLGSVDPTPVEVHVSSDAHELVHA